MRKKILLLAVLFAALILPFSGCHSSAGPAKRLKIGVTLYQGDDTFIGVVRDKLGDIAREYESANGAKITLNIVDAAGNQSTQNDQVDDFISQGYDALCVNMVDRTAAGVIIDKAMASDIPVVFFNREPVATDMQRWEKTFYVGAKAEQSGVMQGALVAEAFKMHPDRFDKNEDGIIQYVMLEGEPGHQDALLRTDYSIAEVQRMGLKVEKLANESANWQRSQGKAKMTEWINRFGERIEVVFANNDDMALGAIDALHDIGYNQQDPAKYIMVVGIDATPTAMAVLADGSLYATVLNDAEKQARAIFELASSMCLGGQAQTSVDGFDGKYLLVDYLPVTSG